MWRDYFLLDLGFDRAYRHTQSMPSAKALKEGSAACRGMDNQLLNLRALFIFDQSMPRIHGANWSLSKMHHASRY